MSEPRTLRFVVQWRAPGGTRALIDFEDESAALAFAYQLAEAGRNPRLDGPLAFDDAPAEVREAAWARAAAAELADRAEALSRARGDVRGLAQAVTALRGMLSGEQLREVSGHA